MTALESKSKPRNWQFTIITGLSIGAGIGAARAVEHNFGPSLGTWASLLACVVTAASVATLVSLVVTFLVKPERSD